MTSVPDTPTTFATQHGYEPTLWCNRCSSYMHVWWIKDTPAWEFCCPTCGAQGQVLP